MRPTRRLRHWKQRFNKDAKFTWNKAVLWRGKPVKVGEPIPKSLANERNKLRRFWEAGVIQLMDFSAPDVLTGQAVTKKVEAPKNGELIKHGDRKWGVTGLDATWPSKKAATAAAADIEALMKAEADAAADAEEAFNASFAEARAEAEAEDAARDKAIWEIEEAKRNEALAKVQEQIGQSGDEDDDDWLDGDADADNSEETVTEEADEAKTDAEEVKED